MTWNEDPTKPLDHMSPRQRDVIVAIRHMQGPAEGGTFEYRNSTAQVGHTYTLGQSGFAQQRVYYWMFEVRHNTMDALIELGLVEHIPNRSGFAGGSLYRLSIKALALIPYDGAHPLVAEFRNWFEVNDKQVREGR